MPPATISEWTWPEKPWHRLHLDLADNGRQFVSGEFEQFTKMNGIRHTKTSPYNPSTNGLAERYEFPGGTANEEKFKIKILEFNSKMGNPREVFHEAVRRQEQFTTGCEVYFRNYATGPKRFRRIFKKWYKQRHLNFEPSTPPTKNRVTEMEDQRICFKFYVKNGFKDADGVLRLPGHRSS
ncbi:K02A2.6-like [Cordylochernes scorpioides]|uniref:K02A2.6-like n=1 Tax=Cordylochernes scorpioides TaxID=51811 RepID=A0ABY6LM23_9ARAC|nr:K02A2.6-like [Cordylochernes scorpioides]